MERGKNLVRCSSLVFPTKREYAIECICVTLERRLDPNSLAYIKSCPEMDRGYNMRATRKGLQVVGPRLNFSYFLDSFRIKKKINK